MTEKPLSMNPAVVTSLGIPMEGLMQPNVIRFNHDPDDQEEVDSFDRLYCQYLNARAQFADTSLDDEGLTPTAGACEELVWQLIRARALRQYQIAKKLKVLRALMNNDPYWKDCRELMLLESIRADVGEEASL